MKTWKVVILTVLTIYLGYAFLFGWDSTPLWEQIFIGLLAFGTGAMLYREVNK